MTFELLELSTSYLHKDRHCDSLSSLSQSNNSYSCEIRQFNNSPTRSLDKYTITGPQLWEDNEYTEPACSVDAIEFSFSCIECTGKQRQTDVQTGEVLQTVYELLPSSKELMLNCELNSDCPAETHYIRRLLTVVPGVDLDWIWTWAWQFCSSNVVFFVMVSNFEPLYLCHFWVKIQDFCPH